MTAHVRARRPATIEIAIFTAGLVASIVAGIVTYQRYGMYGDGPGGRGFHRTSDAGTGASGLTQELMTTEGRVRRTFGVDGTLMEADIDRDNDGNIDECVRIVRGREAGIGTSLAGDGIIDAWVFRDARNQVVRIEISTKRNHRVDRWEYYKGGVVTRVAVDANGEGKPD